MVKKNEPNISAVASPWRSIIPHFSEETHRLYFARLKREFSLWGGTIYTHFFDDGTPYVTGYPLTQEEWLSCFTLYVACCVAPGTYDKRDLCLEPETPLLCALWIEYMSDAQRICHWVRCCDLWLQEAEIEAAASVVAIQGGVA